MDKQEIILITAILVFVAFRIYQKYFRKDQNVPGKYKTGRDVSFSKSKDDDYEPYSGK